MAGQLVVSMPPLKRRAPVPDVAAPAAVPAAVPAAAAVNSAPALRAELQTLRRAEVRLDAALQEEAICRAPWDDRSGPGWLNCGESHDKLVDFQAWGI